jgi:hypothetical protein
VGGIWGAAVGETSRLERGLVPLSSCAKDAKPSVMIDPTPIWGVAAVGQWRCGCSAALDVLCMYSVSYIPGNGDEVIERRGYVSLGRIAEQTGAKRVSDHHTWSGVSTLVPGDGSVSLPGASTVFTANLPTLVALSGYQQSVRLNQPGTLQPPP